ncbi:hypothetical protein [Geodermatophilus sp. YIM 151500]|uniref:arsenate reductase/protein-tyrosine-phosphatase family protein n=1 Tax=Geodermatophilus sp. YIM 151500 TaxID=2984531 RepID=UPI00398D31B9
MRVSDGVDPGRPFTILFVCTGNLCRSPLAERLGRAYLDAAFGERGGAIRLESAGTDAVVGAGMNPDSARVLRGLGGEPEGFVARQLASSMIERADLTLALSRRHRRRVLEMAPRSLARTFTLLEVAELAGYVPAHPDGSGDVAACARAFVRALAAARSCRRGGGDADDIRDPIGQDVTVHQEVGEAISDALLPLLRRLVTYADGSSP